jgi:flavin-dependent dehydrogenase
MDPRQLDADVLIVGGGPAGSAAAIACANRGLKVVLCEREPASRHRPGETLHPGVEPVLAQLGLDAARLRTAAEIRHAGIWVDWAGRRRFEPFGEDAQGPWLGFQAWREDFDALLLARAAEAGVDVRQGCAATGARADEDGHWRVRTGEGELTARMLVDATGAARWLARVLDIACPPRSPQLIARYGYVEGDCPARDEAPALVGDALGWTWTAKVRPRVYQWTRLTLGGARPGPDWAPQELDGLTPCGGARGADVTWRMAEQVAGPGWMMVGDAAATLDPASSHGVLRALVSGMTAAHLIQAALSGAAPAHEAAAAYQGWLAGWFEEDVARLSSAYRELGAPGFG